MEKFDIIVVGGGHAGLEAAFASAHKGHKTLLISLNLKLLGNMPCNPSIGGSAKGIVVREIDALGGMMGKFADHHYLQMKMLNTGKGPAVQCLRAQQDKKEYPEYILGVAEQCENLTLLKGEVVSLLYDSRKVYGVKLRSGEEIEAKAVILTTGTYMNAKIFRGSDIRSEGPDGEKPSIGLSDYLRDMGVEIYRLKTGTPPRIKRDSIDFSKASLELGTRGNLAFSYETTDFIPFEEQIPCYLTYTNLNTHQIIKDNIERSAMYSGAIVGKGPRYCPSIESKIMTFADKERHQLFLEPESRYSDSIYLQGFSTSMPVEVQEIMVRSLPGFENAVFLKYAYAIEYDAIVSTEYKPTLELKKFENLYIAGQICGTSGYEEAAGLGLIAGLNACLKIEGREPLILKRDESYIGVMIDDLTTKGTDEPYRLMSSRAEFRLLLRHDNADIRLTEIGHDVGLISDERYTKFKQKLANIDKAIEILNSVHFGKNLEELLKFKGFEPLKGGVLALEFLKRPGVELKEIIPLIPELIEMNLDEQTIEEIQIKVKFEGYITKQLKEAKNLRKMEKLLIPENIDYLHMDGLALEARSKLDKVRPLNVGQASRVPGVNPSDISVLVLNIKRFNEHE